MQSGLAADLQKVVTAGEASQNQRNVESLHGLQSNSLFASRLDNPRVNWIPLQRQLDNGMNSGEKFRLVVIW